MAVLEAALEDGHSMDLCHDDPTLPQARLLIAPEHAWVMDYYPMTDVIVAPDGSIEASMRYGSQDWMTRLMVGFGPGVRVLGSDDLAASVRNRAEAALAAYGEASTAD